MHLGNGHRHDLGIGLVTRRQAVLQGERLHHCPTPHVQVAYPCRIVVTQQAEHVDVMDHGTDDDRAATHVLQQLIAPLDDLGLLKAQLACQLLHLLHQHVHEDVCVAVQYLADFADVRAVLLGRNKALTTTLAAVDVVLQAQTVLPGIDCFT